MLWCVSLVDFSLSIWIMRPHSCHTSYSGPLFFSHGALKTQSPEVKIYKSYTITMSFIFISSISLMGWNIPVKCNNYKQQLRPGM